MSVIAKFDYILAVDLETSGMFFGVDNPCYDPETGRQYQIVSIGLVVANADTLKPVEELYLEIKWDGVSLWDNKAQSIHGLSLDYLEKNGMDEEEAVVEICNLILKYWGPEGYVSLLGQNVATFDLWFLKHLLKKYDLNVKFSRRHVDSFSLGFGALNTYTSDQLFEAVGLPVRQYHNALDDAKSSLKAARTIRLIVQQALGENQ